MPTGTYFVVNVSANFSSTNVAIAEIQMRSVSGGADLCTGGTAFDDGNIGGGYAGTNAFDNNASTMWNKSGLGAVGYQFASPVTIVEYTLAARNDAYIADSPKDFEVLCSSDGVTYRIADVRTGQPGWTSGEVRIFSMSGAPSANSEWNWGDKTATTNLSGLNLVATAVGGGGGVRAADGKTAGKHYWEFTLTNQVHFQYNVGVATKAASFSSGSGDHVGVAAIECGSGNIYINNTTIAASLGARASGNIIGIALDRTNSLIWFRVAPSGNWNGSGTANPATGTGGLSVSALGAVALYPLFAFPGGTNVVTANFGGTFSGTVPAGFVPGWQVPVLAAGGPMVTMIH